LASILAPQGKIWFSKLKETLEVLKKPYSDVKLGWLPLEVFQKTIFRCETRLASILAPQGKLWLSKLKETLEVLKNHIPM